MKKHSKLYLILVLIVFLSLAAFAPQTALGEAETERPATIDAALWDVMCAADEDEWIPLYIKLDGIDENELFEKVKQKTGMDPAVFLDEALFEKEVTSKIRKAIEETAGMESEQMAGNDERLTDASLASLEAELSGDLKRYIGEPGQIVGEIEEKRPDCIEDFLIDAVIDRFRDEKRMIQQRENTDVNQNFVKRCVEPRQNIIKDIGSCFSYLFVDAKKADILYYAQQEEVALICYDDPDYQFAPA